MPIIDTVKRGLLSREAQESRPLVISFYTAGTPYEEEAKALMLSCKRWKLEHLVEARPSLGSWEKNCAQKPLFILEKLNEHKRPVLWTDADSIFLNAPNFSAFHGCDFSVRLHPSLADDHPSKVVSNTIYVNYTKEAISLVEKWMQNCLHELQDKGRKEEFWDQTALRDAILSGTKAKVVEMPLAYCKIFDSDFFNIAPRDVILEHYQASRRFKKLIR